MVPVIKQLFGNYSCSKFTYKVSLIPTGIQTRDHLPDLVNISNKHFWVNDFLMNSF